MEFADTEEGEHVRATQKGQRGTCPLCKKPVRAKVGAIIAHHWAHESCEDCDSWSEGEGLWHRGWKEMVRPEARERTLRREGHEEYHRADIVGNRGIVVELQHSPISLEEIQEREAFYGRMVWLFDVTHLPVEEGRDDDAPFQSKGSAIRLKIISDDSPRLILSAEERFGESRLHPSLKGDALETLNTTSGWCLAWHSNVVMKWKRPRTTLQAVTPPFYLDLGRNCSEFGRLHEDSPYSLFRVSKVEWPYITGRFVTKEEFVRKYLLDVLPEDSPLIEKCRAEVEKGVEHVKAFRRIRTASRQRWREDAERERARRVAERRAAEERRREAARLAEEARVRAEKARQRKAESWDAVCQSFERRDYSVGLEGYDEFVLEVRRERRRMYNGLGPKLPRVLLAESDTDPPRVEDRLTVVLETAELKALRDVQRMPDQEFWALMDRMDAELKKARTEGRLQLSQDHRGIKVTGTTGGEGDFDLREELKRRNLSFNGHDAWVPHRFRPVRSDGLREYLEDINESEAAPLTLLIKTHRPALLRPKTPAPPPKQQPSWEVDVDPPNLKGLTLDSVVVEPQAIRFVAGGRRASLAGSVQNPDIVKEACDPLVGGLIQNVIRSTLGAWYIQIDGRFLYVTESSGLEVTILRA